jgi:hypothetical protein
MRFGHALVGRVVAGRQLGLQKVSKTGWDMLEAEGREGGSMRKIDGGCTHTTPYNRPFPSYPSSSKHPPPAFSPFSCARWPPRHPSRRMGSGIAC